MLGATAIRRYIAIMEAEGYSPEVFLAGAELSYPMLADPALLISPAQYRSIVNRLAALSQQDGIILATAAFRHLGDLGIVGHASTASRTVRDTYQVWTRFGPPLVGMMGTLRILEEDKSSVTFVVASPEPADPLFQFSVEELLTMVQKVSRAPVDQAPSVARLSLSYKAPRGADRYEELFRCPMRFGAPQTTIRVWKEWFDKPSEPHDGEFSAICLQHCENLLQRNERSNPVVSNLRRLFAQTTATPLPNMDLAARHLNLSPRTLRRRLHLEGTSYRHEIDHFRSERAKQYLSYGTMSSKKVAYLLGFQEQSAFLHAFKTWTGMTVREYRVQASSTRHASHDESPVVAQKTETH